jgi:hypothetical protein
MIEITDGYMSLTIDNKVVATARFSKDAVADGNGAWIVSTHPARLFYRDQAITALTLAERLACGYGDDDPFVKTWRAELHLPNGSAGNAQHARSAEKGRH